MFFSTKVGPPAVTPGKAGGGTAGNALAPPGGAGRVLRGWVSLSRLPAFGRLPALGAVWPHASALLQDTAAAISRMRFIVI